MNNQDKIYLLQNELKAKKKTLSNTNCFIQKDLQNKLFQEIKELNNKIALLLNEELYKGKSDEQDAKEIDDAQRLRDIKS